MYVIKCMSQLVTIGQAPHSAHNTEDIVIPSINPNLGGIDTRNSCVGKNELEGGVVNAREVAGSRRLVLLRPKSKRVNVNTSVRSARVGEEGLDKVKVAALALREPILAVELKFGSNNWILTPAVELECSLGEDKCACIRTV